MSKEKKCDCIGCQQLAGVPVGSKNLEPPPKTKPQKASVLYGKKTKKALMAVLQAHLNHEAELLDEVGRLKNDVVNRTTERLDAEEAHLVDPDLVPNMLIGWQLALAKMGVYMLIDCPHVRFVQEHITVEMSFAQVLSHGIFNIIKMFEPLGCKCQTTRSSWIDGMEYQCPIDDGMIREEFL